MCEDSVQASEQAPGEILFELSMLEPVDQVCFLMSRLLTRISWNFGSGALSLFSQGQGVNLNTLLLTFQPMTSNIEAPLPFQEPAVPECELSFILCVLQMFSLYFYSIACVLGVSMSVWIWYIN
jgi:hypothetical protein